jgi:hypothetical protein
MSKGRPGGNPLLKEHQFQQKHHWDEPCREKMTLMLPPKMKQAIKDGLIKDWQEVARQAIAEAMERANNLEGAAGS